MAVQPFLVSTYARNIYEFGTRKFNDIIPEYVEPVKEHAAKVYENIVIDTALHKEYITQPEYDDTMAYKAAITEPEK